MKPASTRTLPAIPGGAPVVFATRAQIGRKSSDRSDQIGDRSERLRLAARRTGPTLQPIAHDIRLGNAAAAGLRLDFRDELLGRRTVSVFMMGIVLKPWQRRNTVRSCPR
jgi:hypothetical protein